MMSSATNESPHGWGLRVSNLARFMAIIAALIALGAMAAAWFGLAEPLQGFLWFRTSVFVAAGALFVSLLALCIHAIKKSASMGRIGLAWLLAAPIVAYAAFFISQAQKVPALHDITTDLANPPQFTAIKLRGDLNQIVPDGGRAELKALTARAGGRWCWSTPRADALRRPRPCRCSASRTILCSAWCRTPPTTGAAWSMRARSAASASAMSA